MATLGHKCYRCSLVDRGTDAGDLAQLDTITATLAEDGSEVFFTSGYSAREIAQKHARETNGRVYVNNVSRNIRTCRSPSPTRWRTARSSRCADATNGTTRSIGRTGRRWVESWVS